MKACFLGDSYDVVKRSLMGWLQPLGAWAVHPMLTEEEPHFADAFSALVGAPLVSEDVLERRTDRGNYFKSCAGWENLLLDPNTGLRLGKSSAGNSPDHLYLSDLCSIVAMRPGRVTMVFDQSLSRGKARTELIEKLHRLGEVNLDGFAYYSHACFLFVGREAEVVQRARDLLLKEGHLPGCRILTSQSPDPCSSGDRLP